MKSNRNGSFVITKIIVITLALLFTACENQMLEEIRNVSAQAQQGLSVTFDSQGATVPADPEVMYVMPPSTTIDAMPTPPEKSPWFFSGWFFDRDGKGDRFTENTTVDRDLRVFAWWTDERLWPVHFNLNYLDAATSDPVMVVDGNPVERPEDPVREGYVFVNWYSDPESQFVWVFTTPITSVTYLYARWNVGYAVSYNANGATSGSPPATQTKAQGVDLTLASNDGNLERIGYTFVGWNTNADGAGDHYAEGASYEVDAVLALYAQWSANTYTVTLDTDGGTGGPGSVQATFDQPMPSAGAAPTRDGFGFAGYYTQKNGAGTQYYTATMEGARVWDVPSDTTLYAYWLPPSTVALHPNGGSGGSGSVTAILGFPMPLADAPERTGYVFLGYWDATSGGIQYYTNAMASARDWDKTVDMTLYARWEVNTYTVTFNKQSGSGGTNSVTATYGSAMPSATAPTRTGYTFNGYWDATIGGTQYYTAAMASARNWDKAANTTLYARWNPNIYTITFDKQGGSGGTNSVTATYGSAMPSATAPTRTGYTFNGYWDATSGGTQYYTAAMASARNWDKAANTTLYARWIPRTYTVTFNKQSGSGGTNSVTATYDSAMPSATSPTRPGYTFDGYWDVISGGLQYYTAAMASARNWDKAGNATLYARWIPKPYTVTFDKQSGSGGTNSVTATFGSPMPTATAPTRAGFVFDGYYTGTGGGGTQYYTESMASARDWDRISDTTLYAKWRNYVIGDTGPAGGVVFFDKGSYSNGWRYMEAWTADQSGTHQWKTSLTSTPGTTTSIGSGYANTYSAMAGTAHPAAAVVRSATHGGYSDWFLPSRDELNEIVVQKGVIGGFAAGYYWSSSESDASTAWQYNVGVGNRFDEYKVLEFRVRAARRF